MIQDPPSSFSKTLGPTAVGDFLTSLLRNLYRKRKSCIGAIGAGEKYTQSEAAIAVSHNAEHGERCLLRNAMLKPCAGVRGSPSPLEASG
jgi:hypothetical protein